MKELGVKKGFFRDGYGAGGIKELLTDREARVIGLRLIGWTLRDTGITIGVTPERVRQIEAKAMAKIRRGYINSGRRLEREYLGRVLTAIGEQK